MSTEVSTLPAPPSPEPPCLCTPPIPWGERRDDGPWIIGSEVIGFQRTCLCCGASKTIEAA